MGSQGWKVSESKCNEAIESGNMSPMELHTHYDPEGTLFRSVVGLYGWIQEPAGNSVSFSGRSWQFPRETLNTAEYHLVEPWSEPVRIDPRTPAFPLCEQ